MSSNPLSLKRPKSAGSGSGSGKKRVDVGIEGETPKKYIAPRSFSDAKRVNVGREGETPKKIVNSDGTTRNFNFAKKRVDVGEEGSTPVKTMEFYSTLPVGALQSSGRKSFSQSSQISGSNRIATTIKPNNKKNGATTNGEDMDFRPSLSQYSDDSSLVGGGGAAGMNMGVKVHPEVESDLTSPGGRPKTSRGKSHPSPDEFFDYIIPSPPPVPQSQQRIVFVNDDRLEEEGEGVGSDLNSDNECTTTGTTATTATGVSYGGHREKGTTAGATHSSASSSSAAGASARVAAAAAAGVDSTGPSASSPSHQQQHRPLGATSPSQRLGSGTFSANGSARSLTKLYSFDKWEAAQAREHAVAVARAKGDDALQWGEHVDSFDEGDEEGGEEGGLNGGGDTDNSFSGGSHGSHTNNGNGNGNGKMSAGSNANSLRMSEYGDWFDGPDVEAEEEVYEVGTLEDLHMESFGSPQQQQSGTEGGQSALYLNGVSMYGSNHSMSGFGWTNGVHGPGASSANGADVGAAAGIGNGMVHATPQDIRRSKQVRMLGCWLFGSALRI
jgi:hypothetical protein